MRRTSEWIFTQEISSDVTVKVGEASFPLHKYPLISKCGYIRQLVSESSDADDDVSFIELSDVPGGAEAFELAAKFCYGINFEIGVENIAMLRCVAEYLEMTEDFWVGNLVARADSYLNEVALETIEGAVSVLRSSERLLPMAEKAKLVSRCVDSIAYRACRESQFLSARSGGGSADGATMSPAMASHHRPVVEWWAEDLTGLRIDIFKRVLVALLARGFKQRAVGPILMLYAQKSLRGLEIFGNGWRKVEAEQEDEKRVILETLVTLLPTEKNAMSVSFLSLLLRAAIYLGATVACKLDLEKRMAMQLDQACLDDLLIPSYYSVTQDTLFDVDMVQRILTDYLVTQMGNHSACDADDDDQYFSPPQRSIDLVAKLMENYLAEIATDRNLPVSKFISLAELIPETSRATEDGTYRAIDIYLKAHPVLSEIERKKVCSVMDCHKLSREACAHAAQNDRLPAQTVVQVLYYEQQRLRDPAKADPRLNELSNLRRENDELKLEVLRLKMKLKEIDNSTLRSACSSPLATANSPSSDRPPLPRRSFMNLLSRKLGRLSPFLRSDADLAPPIAHVKPEKNWRHSIS